MRTCTRTLNLRYFRGVVSEETDFGTPQHLLIGPIDLDLSLVNALPSSITTLDWDLGDQSDVSLEAVSTMLRMDNLEHLSLKFNNSNNKKILKLLQQCLPGSITLKSLELCKNCCCDDDIENLIPLFAPLDSLNLSYNLLTDRSAHKLADLLSDPSCRLQQLDIRCNKIKGAGMSAIAKSLHTNNTLEHLKVYGNEEVTIHLFLEALMQHNNTTLKKLYAEGGAQTDLLRHFLLLNQSGRRILHQDDVNNSVPSGIWPTFMGRISNDPNQVYYYLRESPILTSRRQSHHC